MLDACLVGGYKEETINTVNEIVRKNGGELKIYDGDLDVIKIIVSDHGAELHSVTGRKENTEFLWNGNPEHWKYHAPHLFPIIGKLVDSKYKVDGKEYELPSHGIARISEFNCLNKTEKSITFELKYDEKSLEIYPYKFLLLEENINDIGAILMSELKSKSLDEFHKEEHICEYKSIFTQEYIRELKRRKYEWTVLSSNLKENYYRDILYNHLRVMHK